MKEKEFRATFEIKGKALYPKLDVLFAMMREILMESKLGDEKRLKEILSMLKTRLQTSFLSAGHTTAVLRSLSYTSPIARFRDITSGIGFYEVVKDLEENFEERKELLIENLKKIAGRIFRKRESYAQLYFRTGGTCSTGKSSATVCRFTSYGRKREPRTVHHPL